MKKIKILSLVLAIAQTLVFASCQNTEENTSSLSSGSDVVSSSVSSEASSEDVSTDISSVESVESETSSEEPSSEEPPSSAPESSEEDSQPVSSEVSSSAPVEDDEGFTLLDPLSDVMLADFSNSAFVGNSIIHGFYTYGVVPDADIYAYTSINVSSVYTREIPHLGNKTIMEAIDSEKCGKLYDKIFILLGINEIGNSYSVTANRYATMIQDLKDIQPNAEIYVLAVFPVTEKEDGDGDVFSMENINALNGHLRDMCVEQDVNFLNINACLKNSAGYLATSIAARDGIHIKKNGCQHITAFIHSVIFIQE